MIAFTWMKCWSAMLLKTPSSIFNYQRESLYKLVSFVINVCWANVEPLKVMFSIWKLSTYCKQAILAFCSCLPLFPWDRYALFYQNYKDEILWFYVVVHMSTSTCNRSDCSAHVYIEHLKHNYSIRHLHSLVVCPLPCLFLACLGTM